MPTASPWLPTIEQLSFAREHTVGSTVYAAPQGSKEPTSTRANNEELVIRSCRLSNLSVHVTAFTTSDTGTATLLVNGTATSLAVEVDDNPVVGGWVTNEADYVEVSPGDKICIELVRPGASAWSLSAMQMLRMTP